MKHTFPLLAAICALAACGDPQPLTVDRQDFNAAVLANKNASLLAVTPVNEIPSGSATYAGTLTSSARINDDFGFESGYQIIGDLDMRADFGANSQQDIRGSVTNINLIDRNIERANSQQLRGSLDVNGVSALGGVVANATGELTAVFDNNGFLRTSDVDLDLIGDVVTDQAPGDTIHGTVDGGGSGGFDLDLTGDGRFTIQN